MSNFLQEQLQKWEAFLNRLFNGNVPTTAEWTNLLDIQTILDTIGKSDALNHTFFPESGGLDLESAILSVEPGCLELICNESVEIVKPKRLTFHSYGPGRTEWAYFRLETEHLPQSGVYDESDEQYEEVTEISPGHYVSRDAWETNEYFNQPLPAGARLVTRHLYGSFATFSKASSYNQNNRLGAYEGNHDRMNDQQFREFIERIM